MGYRQHFDTLRRLYSFRCGYCTVHESEAGCTFTIDHFVPQSAGGSDDIDNLVYACPACNLHKHDFHPTNEQWSQGKYILHPLRDNRSLHWTETDEGMFVPITETGSFNITRLKLNRPGLVALREHRRRVNEMMNRIIRLQGENEVLAQQLLAAWRSYYQNIEGQNSLLTTVNQLLEENNELRRQLIHQQSE